MEQIKAKNLSIAVPTRSDRFRIGSTLQNALYGARADPGSVTRLVLTREERDWIHSVSILLENRPAAGRIDRSMSEITSCSRIIEPAPKAVQDRRRSNL